MNPKGFKHGNAVFLLGRIELLHPFLGRSHHFIGIQLADLNAGPMTDIHVRMLEVFEEFLDGKPVDLNRLLKRLALVDHAIDPPVLLVAIRVTDVVLHVSDDDIVPVSHVERTVFTKDGIGRAEVFVTALHGLDGGSPPNLAELVLVGFKSIPVHLILLDAEIADGVAEDEVLLPVIREVHARNNGVGGHRANLFLYEGKHPESFAIGTDLIGTPTSSVVGVKVTPLVEAGPVRIGTVSSH